MKKINSAIIALLLIVWTLPQSVSAAKMLVPVGEVIGLELADDTVCVAAFDEALGATARKAGLQVGDRLVKLDGQPVRSIEDVRKALNAADGSVQARILRGGKNKNLTLQPVVTAQGPKLGVYLKEGITGVGTVTYFDPDTGNYGALGHGVNTSDGALLQLRRGQAYRAQILSVRKGRAGAPGQLADGGLCQGHVSLEHVALHGAQLVVLQHLRHGDLLGGGVHSAELRELLR